MTVLPVHPSSEARALLPEVLRRFRSEGAAADPLIFGAQRRPEAAVIPYALYEALAPAIEELEIAEVVRERTMEPSRPLSDLAAELGLDPEKYR